MKRLILSLLPLLVCGNMAMGQVSTSTGAQTRPDHVNNALRKYFPPVFNQAGGSCGSAMAVGYMMTYEMNAYNHTDASTTDHQLPTHFVWLQDASGITKFDIMDKHGVPTADVYGGRTYSSLFGNQDTESSNFGYMQGYDKWYNAMFHRIVGGDVFCDGRVNTSAVGREQLKQWLWNHWGDDSFGAGGVGGYGVAIGGKWGNIPKTATNDALGVTGKKFVAAWGEVYNHALTIVGYDDRIEFDLDSNGVYGETDKDEVGAWIICNSWGNGWCNGGFIYCPYKYSVNMANDKGAMDSGHYTWRKDYRPERTFKILMSYDHRSELQIMAGISTDTTATAPQKTDIMPYFNYAGDGTKSSPSPAVPLLGRWRTGLNYAPMEFGYDLTDLTQGCDLTKPVKYFLVINTKANAVGKGQVYKLSLMDYTIDPEGMETSAGIDSVSILNNGQTTTISFVVQGQQLFSPVNVSLNQKHLTWAAPRSSSYDIARYYVYKGTQKVAEVPSFSYSYTVDDPQATYYVAAAYSYRDGVVLSQKAGPARNSELFSPEGTNKVLSLTDECLSVPDVFSQSLPQATIEFWIKPNSLKNYNQQVGMNWGSFLMTTTLNGQIICGWNPSNRCTASSRSLRANTWTHVAVTVDNNQLVLYVNGLRKGSVSSTDYSGIPALTSFSLGTQAGTFDGYIDELRVWKTALTQNDIYRNMNLTVANPAAQTDLLAYYPMEVYVNNGQRYLKDYAGGHDIPLTAGESVEDASVFRTIAITSTADFSVPQDSVYAGQPVEFRSHSMVNAAAWGWSAPGAEDSVSTARNATFTFPAAGTYSVTHTVTDANGLSLDSTHQITVITPDAPTADFIIAADTLGEGEIFHFANQSKAADAKYSWAMPGADQERVNAVNATATYSKTGTYPITLTATNQEGTSQKTAYVVVTHSAPRVLFSASPDAIMLGETAYLVDDTRNSPTEWKWTVSNGKHSYIISGQNSSLTPTHPGNYQVKLEATNDVGTTADSLGAALVVYNADSKNGLNFTGHESLLSTADPFPNGTRAFTIEWWMSPAQSVGALDMSTTNEAFSLSTDQDGITSLTIGGKTATSQEGYVLTDGWHHYAVTFNFGTVNFYRDGELINKAATRTGNSTTAWGKLTVSGGDNKYVGQIDELRIWGRTLPLSTMKNYINAPLTDIDNLTEKQGLLCYYDFNQNGGTVKDRTSNGIDLERQGFGPDGDAWGLSKGVFTLDLDNAADPVQVDADGLTSIQNAVAEGKAPAIQGGNGVIRFVMDEPTEVFVYSADGRLTFRDTVEGTHYLPFRPGIYIANGVKVRVD